MKGIFGVICLTASLAAVSATFCKSEDDCKEGFCCVGLTMTQMMRKGLCLRLTRERRQCSEPESKNDYYGGKYTRYCPCAEGMVCQPNKPGITDPEKRIKALRCQKPSATTTGPDVTTGGEIVTDGEVTNPPDVVTDDNIVDETLPPEIVTEETETPEEEVVETEGPEEEVVETEGPEEEVVETEAPEEEVVEPEEEVVEPEEEVVEPEEEVVEPEEEVVEPEEEVVEPEEEVVEDETPEEEIPEEAGQRGPGGERPREDDPDCEDWTYGC